MRHRDELRATIDGLLAIEPGNKIDLCSNIITGTMSVIEVMSTKKDIDRLQLQRQLVELNKLKLGVGGTVIRWLSVADEAMGYLRAAKLRLDLEAKDDQVNAEVVSAKTLLKECLSIQNDMNLIIAGAGDQIWAYGSYLTYLRNVNDIVNRGVERGCLPKTSTILDISNIKGHGSVDAFSQKNYFMAAKSHLAKVTAELEVFIETSIPPVPANGGPKVAGRDDPPGELTLLFVAANPSDSTRLALDEEARDVERTIQQARGSIGVGQGTTLTFKSAWATRAQDLLHVLNQHRPDIVHFSGHGSSSGDIILANDNGESAPVSAELLGQLFETMKDNIKAVVLNACYSEIQAQAISRSIDYVVGMDNPINDKAAIAFATNFYSALSFGRSFPEAFAQAKLAMLLGGYSAVSPVLLSST